MAKHAEPTIPPAMNSAPKRLTSLTLYPNYEVASPITVPSVLKVP